MKSPTLVAAAAAVLLIATLPPAAATPTPTTQRTSAFYPPHVLTRIRANADASDWGRDIRTRAIAAAEPWKRMSDNDLWQLVFGATIGTRTKMGMIAVDNLLAVCTGQRPPNCVNPQVMG